MEFLGFLIHHSPVWVGGKRICFLIICESIVIDDRELDNEFGALISSRHYVVSRETLAMTRYGAPITKHKTSLMNTIWLYLDKQQLFTFYKHLTKNNYLHD